ncbi:MAG: NAD-dependent DNA ligase LigA [Lachnospiraceae bacterium]|nr:NAD-dependent DNA ligase LigA [Lachnospiraceae bacterium]
MERMKELIALLNKASESYYQKDETIISDYEFDKLYDELLALENKYGVVLSGSPTQKVGYDVLSSLKKVRHKTKMLSLDKTKNWDKLYDWLGDKEGLLSFKMDGLTIVLYYENGELIQAVTRGNGEIGEDITHNARFFKNIPIKISYKGKLTIRGEGVISFLEFERINKNLPPEEAYKNPRNLCSGTVRQLNSKISADRNVMFFAFSMVTDAGNNINFETKLSELLYIKELGFDTVFNKATTKDSIRDDVKFFENKIKSLGYATDGLVLTYNNIKYGKSLGATSKFPKDSIAFKWADETENTILRKMIWNTSRTGLINPVALFDPVEIEGTTVSRASVHNLSIVEELKLGIGDEIKVYKANMIIPQILENITKSGTVKPPEACPVCGEKTKINEFNGVKLVYCLNPNCKAQLVRSLSHYTSRDAANIEGLSEETIKKLVETGILDNYTNIYRIYQHEEIKDMEGLGEKSFANIVSAIEKSKDIELSNFIYALGISQMGLNNARILCKSFDYDIEKIINATEEDLIAINSFGSVIAGSVVKYFSSKNNIKLLRNALSYIRIKSAHLPSEDVLSGLGFVITGDLKYFKNRKELEALIESKGGGIASSVSSKTSYLINNDLDSESSKNKKAKELNIPIISEEELITEILKEKIKPD